MTLSEQPVDSTFPDLVSISLPLLNGLVLKGTRKDDQLVGSEQNDMIRGQAGDDKVQAGSSNDRIFGGSGNDRLAGNENQDWLNGGIGFDRLMGGSGDDSLKGGNGNDILIGGLGQDEMVGSNGADIFVLTIEGSESQLVDVIHDFSAIQDDKLRLGAGLEIKDLILSGFDSNNDGIKDATLIRFAIGNQGIAIVLDTVNTLGQTTLTAADFI